jgi:hypothetical protein
MERRNKMCTSPVKNETSGQFTLSHMPTNSNDKQRAYFREDTTQSNKQRETSPRGGLLEELQTQLFEGSMVGSPLKRKKVRGLNLKKGTADRQMTMNA